jgi:curli biogenesis system outer membrane secretion channel CsgG
VSTICSMIQGFSPLNQFKVDANKSKDFPPSQKIKVGVLTFIAPAAGVSKYSPSGPEGTYTTPANTGVSVADAVSYQLMNVPNVILIERAQLEKILNEHKLSLPGVVNNPDYLLLGQILPVDALIFGSVTIFQLWNDMAGHGGIVEYSARLVNIHTTEVLFSIRCNAVKRKGMPMNIVNDLSRDAIKKLLEK